MIGDNEESVGVKKSSNRRKHNEDLNEREEDFDLTDDENSDENSNENSNYSLNSEELYKNVIVDDKNNRKLFRKVMIQTRRPPLTLYSMDRLLRVGCNAFAYHRLTDASKLMPAFIKDLRCPHTFLVNGAFILLTQKGTDSSLLVKSMQKLSKYDVNKRVIMLEMVLNFIRNNEIIEAKNYIESNESFMRLEKYRKNILIDTYLKCYINYVDYIEWKQTIEDPNDNIFYHSNRLIAERIRLNLKNIISETKDLILDIFVLTLLDMYEYSQMFAEAYDILQVYVENNPNHLNGYIYLYNFCVKYPDYCTQEVQTNSLKQILKYSPENPLILDLIETDCLKTEDKFTLLLDFVDYKQHFNDLNAWTLIKQLIGSIEDEDIGNELKHIWSEKYEDYWLKLHFNVKQIKQLDENTVELIRCKQKVIEFFYLSTHSYITLTNQMIDKYNPVF